MSQSPHFRDAMTAAGEVSKKPVLTAGYCAPSPPITQPEPAPTEPENIVQWAITKLGFTPTPKQEEILTSTAKYIILCCNRQWGKTTTIAAKALYTALQTPNYKIAVLARSEKQAGLMVAKMIEFTLALGLPTRRVLGHEFSLRLPNESTIVAVPHTLHSSLGRTANILIVDEAASVTDEVYHALSAFVAQTHGKLWLLSTPLRQTGFFYNFWHDTESGWHRIFSNVHDCPSMDPGYLAMQQRANPIRYSQDFLCQFSQPANRLCSRETANAILRKKGDDTPSGAGMTNYIRGVTGLLEPKTYTALDLGQRFDHSAIVSVELSWSHRGHDPYGFAQQYQPILRLTSLHRFPLGLSYEEVQKLVIDRLATEHRKLELIVDAGGPGPPVVDRLRNALASNIMLKPVIITGGKGQNTLSGGYTGIPRRSLLSTLLMAMSVGSLVCEEGTQNWELFVNELVELSGDTTHPAGGAMHDDLVMAVALAVYAAVRDTPSLLPGVPCEPESKAKRPRYGHQPNPLL